jgi:hypothetical protein
MNTLIWPDVFADNSLIETREPAALLADGLCAWGNVKAGKSFGPIPKSFGETMVKITNKLGMKSGLPEAFHEKANEMFPKP